MACFRSRLIPIACLAAGLSRGFGLSLDSLLAMALRNNPDLAASRQGTVVAAQDTLLPRVLENPVISAEAMHNLTEPGKPKTGFRISQEFRPGYRSAQGKLAKSDWSAALSAQQAHAADLATDIRSLWWSWQILHRKQALQQAVADRWESLARIASAKVAEGRLSEVEEAQARLDQANALQRVAASRSAKLSLEHRMRYLAQAGSEALDTVALDSLPALPSLDSILARLAANSPELKALDAEIAARKSQVDWQRASRNVPVRLSAGYDREGDGSNLVGGGIELPLAIFNRNQVGIAKAQASLREAELRRSAARQRLAADARQAYTRLAGMAGRYGEYAARIRPLSRKQLALSEKGFRQGLLGIFELSRIQQESLAQESEALDLFDSYQQEWIRQNRSQGEY
jgi:cobalt-zinc-cadmium efflux system outer membrane protein